jgi:mono/diheme cytochrome c family protein
MLKKLLLGLLALILAVISGLAITIAARWDRRFEAPETTLAASSDPAVIARGRYLAFGPAHCVDCHAAPEPNARWRSSNETTVPPPLVGSRTFMIPPGAIHVPNLTPDTQTGIGRRSDADLVRILRYGVRADGRAAIPFMEFQHLSDADLVAILSFLRSQPPVHNPVPDHELTVTGKAVMAFLIKPIGPGSTPPAESPAPGPTLERGAYLVSAVGNCAGCHTERSMLDGSYTGPMLAGGGPMESETEPPLMLVPPNLTPDSATGRMAGWTEAEFVARFREGERVRGSPMPWRAYAQMSDDDLRAIYRYLRSVVAVAHDPVASSR